ncbi:Uncharacterised protein r2_g1778 [Pycnogonum litorale]
MFINTFSTSITNGVVESCVNHNMCKQDKVRQFFDGLLADNYSKMEYPNVNSGTPLIIGHSFNFESVSDVRLNTMDVKLVYWHTMSWFEPRLQKHMYGKKKKVHLGEEGMNYFWTPKIAGHPIKSLSLLKGKDRNIYLTMEKGHMLLSLQIVAVAACAMDLTAYPLDTQKCEINYESVDYGADTIINEWRSDDSSIVIYPVVHNQLPEYDFNIKRGTPYFVKYDGMGEWSELNMTLILKRRITGHILHTFIPSAIFVIMALLAFLIPSRLIQPRWALVITSMLTLTTQMTSVRSSLPPMASLRGIDIWSVTCFFMMFVILISMTIFTFLFSIAKDEEASNRHSDGNSKIKNYVVYRRMKAVSLHAKCVRKYQLVCFVLTLCFFFLFNIGFWGYYTKAAGRW